MTSEPKNDWDPRGEAALGDQIAVYDDMRQRCPVAHSDYLHWSLFRHEDVARVLDDHDSFSNHVSRHLSVPNGMDPPEHTAYRRILDPYFSAQRMDAFEPACRGIAAKLVSQMAAREETDLMAQFAQDFALQVQSDFLGWPAALHEPLRHWIGKNHAATLAGDTGAMNALAFEFDSYIQALLTARRDAGADAPDDITTSLLRDRIGKSLLGDRDIISILRNWTVGELSTIASCVGILVHYLAERPSLQQQLREEPALLPAAIDEILRIHAPLIASRRITTRQVKIGERTLAAGERISLIWASANRSETVFGNPDEFRLDRDPALNLLYGAGIHVCPGAPLARMSLRICMEQLLARTVHIALMPGMEALKAVYPASGFSVLPLSIRYAP
ncbi:cytochrome P450 [Massilia sp. TWP1-3-3]|uniref:cytochrome P450 n=1 Tax=Massilia sp. TWP1-3-3 TaxID=2804573 RepID=UPI003CF17100